MIQRMQAPRFNLIECRLQRLVDRIASARDGSGPALRDAVYDWAGLAIQTSVCSARLSASSTSTPRSGSVEQFELNWPVRLLLHDRCPRPQPATTDEFANPNFHDVAAAQLASTARSNRARSRNRPSRSSQNRIAHTCCGFSACFAPTIWPAFQGRRSRAAGSNSECPIVPSMWPDWPAEMCAQRKLLGTWRRS
jgi:hypothetical protein